MHGEPCVFYHPRGPLVNKKVLESTLARASIKELSAASKREYNEELLSAYTRLDADSSSLSEARAKVNSKLLFILTSEHTPAACCFR